MLFIKLLVDLVFVIFFCGRQDLDSFSTFGSMDSTQGDDVIQEQKPIHS